VSVLDKLNVQRVQALAVRIVANVITRVQLSVAMMSLARNAGVKDTIHVSSAQETEK
jgi:Na+/glutamate symporter